ncbi:hypothetical protein SMSP2_00056 [Limihaloglobus sulfuriphilus]|uniref:Uncharacterized protein n=1 Tax=Limihaloglobus sulfuriphilus TaxID=1851148 RepID=A0A1Q2MAL8_9BACT|nr:hypothetical protein [Limihaloglobus sulfuriphilus]AQQ69726.1 hypothetical protein SMSP2_00056 [Limihaloglobus sulfuriphilus]
MAGFFFGTIYLNAIVEQIHEFAPLNRDSYPFKSDLPRFLLTRAGRPKTLKKKGKDAKKNKNTNLMGNCPPFLGQILQQFHKD